MDEEIVVTYETLYDILIQEKRSNELQKLDLNFLRDVLEYFKDKSKLLKTSLDSPFGAEEQRKTFQQLENARKLLREIYDWREKKLLLLARDASRMNDHLVNKSVMLSHERILYDEALALMKRNRTAVLDSVINLREPTLTGMGSFSSASVIPEPAVLAPVPAANNGVEAEFPDTDQFQSSEASKASFQESAGSAAEPPQSLKTEDSASDKIRIRFNQEVAQFVGPGMESFGPYIAGDEANLPEIVANIIIKREQGDKI
jgi:hypothetical protein